MEMGKLVKSYLCIFTGKMIQPLPPKNDATTAVKYGQRFRHVAVSTMAAGSQRWALLYY